VNNKIPYVDFFSPFMVYADGGYNVFAEIWDLPQGCSTSDLQLSIEIVHADDVSKVVSVFQLGELGDDSFELIFQSTAGAPGMASVVISMCGKFSRPFEIQYVEVPWQNPEMSMSRMSGFCNGEEKISIVLTGMRTTDIDNIRVKFGTEELSAETDSMSIVSSMQRTTVSFDIPNLSQSGNTSIKVWSESNRLLEASSQFMCSDFSYLVWTSSSRFYGCPGPLASRVLISIENSGDEISMPCSNVEQVVDGDFRWEIEETPPVTVLWMAKDVLTQAPLSCIAY